MKTFEELKQEAIAKGIKPGALVRSPYGKEWVAGPTNSWDVDSGGGLHDRGSQIYSTVHGRWATVITPAPDDQPQGLVDGMACEPDEHMRRAIVEKAIELGLAGENFAPPFGSNTGIQLRDGLLHRSWSKATVKTDKLKYITPGEFYDRLCKTVKPEPSICIGGHEVKFGKGEITVGCTTVPNDIVRKVAERLKD